MQSLIHTPKPQYVIYCSCGKKTCDAYQVPSLQHLLCREAREEGIVQVMNYQDNTMVMIYNPFLDGWSQEDVESESGVSGIHPLHLVTNWVPDQRCNGIFVVPKNNSWTPMSGWVEAD